MKFTDPSLPAHDENGVRKDRRVKMRLGLASVRGPNGKLDSKLVAEAKRLTMAVHGRLVNGQAAIAEPTPARALHDTVFGAFQMALDRTTGKYADTSGR